MTGAITWEQIMFYVLLIGGVVGILTAYEGRRQKPLRNIQEKMDSLEKELASFQLQVAREYASQALVSEAERRILARVGEIVVEIHSLRESVDDAVKQFMTLINRGTRRR